MASGRTVPSDLVAGVLAGDRTAIGRAITLVESVLPEHRVDAAALLDELLPHSGGAHRVGITGVPGVGKSTFIEALGLQLTGSDHKVAVLAVDPSSSRTGGSILGDKTRMAQLSVDPGAFIRPSPSAGTLGGVTRATREAMIVLEAAGHDVVLVETVGVGQSETVVHGMVDVFVVLMLSGAGDELQGIKKGVLELADLLAVNKADGANVDKAKQAAVDYRRALHLVQPPGSSWEPPVLTCSAIERTGLAELWSEIERHRALMTETGERDERRRKQKLTWMRTMLQERLLAHFDANPMFAAARADAEAAVSDGSLTPSVAVDQLLDRLGP
ncbi:MAG TPA: methylmalonyl Co-A mutase-associated GTPase MeaB [Acidimicrobiaceae bacterium]|nr:methylmalonyl Co-A mutase-associated GTPase MeaB [Acidimicrobiaceae bacterium]